MNGTYQQMRFYAAQTMLASTLLVSAFGAAAAPPQSATCKEAQDKINKSGLASQTLSDLVAHPTLAGATQKITVRIKDALGRPASDSCLITIPQVDFRHPIAVGMVELRRSLAQDSRQAAAIAQRFDKLITDKAATVSNPDTLAVLKTIQKNMTDAKDAEALETVVRDMWEVMQRLEQENMTAIERRLAEMEQKLREALERDAADEELRKITKDAMSATKDALKEQAAKAGKDAQAKKDFDEMQKKLDEMKKMLEQLEQMDPKLAQDMQKMMQQLQEMMKQQKQQQQNQDSPQSQQNQQQQQDQQQQMRQSMQQQMQKMMQQMEQQQQMQQMQQDLNKLIKEQEALRDQTAEEREKRKEDMKAVLQQLEAYAKQLKENIEKQRTEEYQRQYKNLPPPPSRGGPGGWEDGMSFNKSPYMMRASLKGGNWQLAEALPPPQGDASSVDAIQQRIRILNELSTKTEETAKPLKGIRESGRQMRESEAEDFIRRFQQIQAELKQKQEELEKSDPQAADEQIKQGRQEQEGMLERIKKLMEEMQQKKPQQQQGQKKPQSQEQQELQKKLNELMKKMREKGMDPGKLDDAEKSMGDAKKELDKNAPGDAVPKQDEALDQLREGEEQMKQQMKKVPGKGPGPGEGQGSEHTNRQPTDIMGRPVPRSPQELGPITSQNLSRERREAIHKLLENAKLPPIQREYLERLLNGGKPKSMAPQP